MSETNQYRSDAFAAIHETMDALQQIGAIDKATMRNFDQTCLEPAPNCLQKKYVRCDNANRSHNPFLPAILMCLKILSRIGSAVLNARVGPPYGFFM